MTRKDKTEWRVHAYMKNISFPEYFNTLIKLYNFFSILDTVSFLIKLRFVRHMWHKYFRNSQQYYTMRESRSRDMYF